MDKIIVALGGEVCYQYVYFSRAIPEVRDGAFATSWEQLDKTAGLVF